MELRGSGVSEAEVVSLLKDCIAVVTKKHGARQPSKEVVHFSSQFQPADDLEKMFPGLCVCVYVCMCAYVCMCGYIYMYACICMWICTYVLMCVGILCMYRYVYSMCVCIHVCICAHYACVCVCVCIIRQNKCVGYEVDPLVLDVT